MNNSTFLFVIVVIVYFATDAEDEIICVDGTPPKVNPKDGSRNSATKYVFDEFHI